MLSGSCVAKVSPALTVGAPAWAEATTPAAVDVKTVRAGVYPGVKALATLPAVASSQADAAFRPETAALNATSMSPLRWCWRAHPCPAVVVVFGARQSPLVAPNE